MSFSNKVGVGLSCLKYKFLKKRVPLLVSLSVTGRCNLKCPYCYISVFTREPSEPSYENLCKHIDDFISMGTRIFFIQGGEPFLRKDIVDLIKYIKKHNCYVSVTTNGTVHKKLPELKGIVDHVQFSLDGGSPEINDKTRGEGVFLKVMKAAQIVKENRIKFHFHTVLNSKNIDQGNLDSLSKISNQLGTYFNACFASDSGYENSQQFNSAVSDKKQKELYHHLIKIKKEGAPLSNNLQAFRHAINWPLPYNVIGNKNNLPNNYKYRCIHGRLTAWFDHEGWLYPCTQAFGRSDLREKVDEKQGVIEAWEKLSKIQCLDCGIASDIEPLFNLNPKILFEALTNKY